MIPDSILSKSNLPSLEDTMTLYQKIKGHMLMAVACLALSIFNKFCLNEKLSVDLNHWSSFLTNRTMAVIPRDDNSFIFTTIAVVIPALSWFCMYNIVSMIILKSMGAPKKGNNELSNNQQKFYQNQSTSAIIPVHNNPLNCIVEAALTHKDDIQSLSTEDSIAEFKKIMEILTETHKSSEYGNYLREAEEHLLKIEENCPSLKNETMQMRNQYHHAFLCMPSGPSTLTQLDIDHFKRCFLVPDGVICQNEQGEKFSKPSVSADQLVSHFFSLGYSKIMHSREVENFDEIKETCDIIILGIKKDFSFFPTWSWSATNDEERSFHIEIKKLNNHFLRDQKGTALGYQSVKIKLIAELKDQERARQFIAQGFQICVILVYPKV